MILTSRLKLLGLVNLIAALHLSNSGLKVTIIETSNCPTRNQIASKFGKNYETATFTKHLNRNGFHPVVSYELDPRRTIFLPDRTVSVDGLNEIEKFVDMSIISHLNSLLTVPEITEDYIVCGLDHLFDQLWTKLRTDCGVTVIVDNVESIHTDREHAKLSMDSGTDIEADFVVVESFDCTRIGKPHLLRFIWELKQSLPNLASRNFFVDADVVFHVQKTLRPTHDLLSVTVQNHGDGTSQRIIEIMSEQLKVDLNDFIKSEKSNMPDLLKREASSSHWNWISSPFRAIRRQNVFQINSTNTLPEIIEDIEIVTKIIIQSRKRSIGITGFFEINQAFILAAFGSLLGIAFALFLTSLSSIKD